VAPPLRGLSCKEPTMGDRTGNEPSPLIIFGIAIVPIIAVLAWFAF
jgi:hypothetical protein